MSNVDYYTNYILVIIVHNKYPKGISKMVQKQLFENTLYRKLV